MTGLPGFMTFALDRNPVGSMVPVQKLTGEPDAKISPQGSGVQNGKVQ
jgi:hypothetical protein